MGRRRGGAGTVVCAGERPEGYGAAGPDGEGGRRGGAGVGVQLELPDREQRADGDGEHAGERRDRGGDERGADGDLLQGDGRELDHEQQLYADAGWWLAGGGLGGARREYGDVDAQRGAGDQ